MSRDDGPGSDVLLVLERSRDRGFLGPGPVADHVTHAEAFATVLGEDFAGTAVDLGCGGGVPGLILARSHPDSRWLLIDANLRRVGFVERAVRDLGLAGRVRVRHVRAEDLAREADWRGAADAVVARSFGPPGVVAECAAPLLRVGGRLIVSDPPTPSEGRWPAAGLRTLGLVLRELGPRAGFQMAELGQQSECPRRFPRRPGAAARSPLF